MTALDRAWQAAFAAEQEAVFGYGRLGPRLAADDRATAREFAADHEALQDATAASLTAAGITAPPPAVDYPDLGGPVADAAAAVRLALQLEERCAAAWRYLYLRAASDTTATAARLRATAQANLTSSAIRATRWRGRPTPFPGV